jgi:hypothetical protein
MHEGRIESGGEETTGRSCLAPLGKVTLRSDSMQTHTRRDRQTDRLTDRQTDRMIHTQTDRKTD